MGDTLSNKTKDLIFGGVILFFSIFMLLESRNIPVGILDKQIGFVASPKGFLVIIALSLLILSVLLIRNALKNSPALNKTNNNVKKDNSVPKEVLISMIILLFYVATIRIFGFFVNSFILLTVTMTIYYPKEKNIKLKGKKQIAIMVLKFSVLSIISLIIFHQVFVRLLNVDLPRNIFGF